MGTTRVVITGYGVIAPNISSGNDFRNILIDGKCTYTVVPDIGPNGSSVVCGQINKNFNVIGGKNHLSYPRVSRLALAAAQGAVDLAGWGGLNEFDANRVAVVIGSSAGGLLEIEEGTMYSKNQDYAAFPRLGASSGNFHSTASAVSAHFGLKGISLTVGSGCTAGVDAINMGKALIESGQIDSCLVGGADAPITSFSLYSFAKLRGIALNVDVCNTGVPFSMSHDGFVIAEGAAVLALETEESALRRGAYIYGVVQGVSSNNDAIAIHRSDPSGKSMLKALKATLNGHSPSYVNSQALGLHENDRVEQYVHQQLFGKDVPLTSIKGMIGHPFAAAGVFQVISALQSIEYGFIPGTTKTKASGYEDLPIIFETRTSEVESVAITTHGFGGNNTCLLITRLSKGLI